jgi:hypothetical protein
MDTHIFQIAMLTLLGLVLAMLVVLVSLLVMLNKRISTAAAAAPVDATSDPQVKVDNSGPVWIGDHGPNGKPFERDGRWWFRRDGELLVYNDHSRRWEPTGVEELGLGMRVVEGPPAEPQTEQAEA